MRLFFLALQMIPPQAAVLSSVFALAQTPYEPKNKGEVLTFMNGASAGLMRAVLIQATASRSRRLFQSVCRRFFGHGPNHRRPSLRRRAESRPAAGRGLQDGPSSYDAFASVSSSQPP